MNKISYIGFAVGITVMALSIGRWFFILYDPSQMILGISIGIIVCGFAYIYDWMRVNASGLGKVNARVDAVVKWMGKMEIE